MRISLQVVVHTEDDTPATVTEIAQFERDGLDAGTLGLHLTDAKSLLSRLQRTLAEFGLAANDGENCKRPSVTDRTAMWPSE